MVGGSYWLWAVGKIIFLLRQRSSFLNQARNHTVSLLSLYWGESTLSTKPHCNLFTGANFAVVHALRSTGDNHMNARIQ